MASEALEAALDEYKAACAEGNMEEAARIREGFAALEGGEIEDAAESFSDENPDEALAEAIETLEPAAGEVAEAAIQAGRPDLAAEVVGATLSTLADWAEGAEDLAETLTEVAEEIEDEGAMDAAEDAAEAAGVAAAETEDTLEAAGVPEPVAEILTEPQPDIEDQIGEVEIEVAEMEAAQEVAPDVAPDATHWLFRRRLGRR